MDETTNGVQVLDVAQIALTVGNLAEARRFYGEVLGLKFLFDAGTMAFYQCGSVRLMVSEAEKAVPSDGTLVYLRVADLAASAQRLESRGVRMVQQPHLVAKMEKHDLWLAFVKDPAGNTLGLMSEVARA